jgi:ribosomal protein L40E
MASLASLVTITAGQSAVWRRCRSCDALSPLAPNHTHCRTCRSNPQRTSRSRLPRAA